MNILRYLQSFHISWPIPDPGVLFIQRLWVGNRNCVGTISFCNKTQVQRLNIVVLAFLLRDQESSVDVALALTFEVRTMTTHIVVFREEKDRPQDTIFKEISEGIQDRVDLADHPALCLIVIAFGNHQDCMSESKNLERDLKLLRMEILEKVYDPDRSASIERTRSFYNDIEDLKRELNTMIFAKAAAIETLRTYLQRYEHILEFIQAVEDLISKL